MSDPQIGVSKQDEAVLLAITPDIYDFVQVVIATVESTYSYNTGMEILSGEANSSEANSSTYMDYYWRALEVIDQSANFQQIAPRRYRHMRESFATACCYAHAAEQGAELLAPDQAAAVRLGWQTIVALVGPAGRVAQG